MPRPNHLKKRAILQPTGHLTKLEYHLVGNQRGYLGMKTYLDLDELKQLEEQARYMRDGLLIWLLARLGC
jgi:hypothetical protein